MSAASSAEAPPFTTIQAEVARYLRTGDSNQWLTVWSGDDLFARARCADSLLREALIATRRREWLLGIAFDKRETFAYACEAYSRLLELGESRSSRQAIGLKRGDLGFPDKLTCELLSAGST